MRRFTIDPAVFTSALILLAFAPSIAVAMEVTINAQSTNSHGAWQFTQFKVEQGDCLIFSDASGTWQDGDSVSGPAGSTKPWPDNFLNLEDLGSVGPYEAKTNKEYWNALVGYIGDLPPAQGPPPPPPARGSYAFPSSDPDIRSKAERVFPIFPQPDPAGGSDLAPRRLLVKQPGLLYLAFNADAYSNYTVDNSGGVKVFIQQDSNRRPNVDVEQICNLVPVKLFQSICDISSLFVDGPSPNVGSCQQTTFTPIPSIPIPPSDINVFITSEGSGIGVEWKDNSKNEDGFDIAYHPTQDINNAQHAMVVTNQTFLSSDWGLALDENELLQRGQTLCFQVSAYNVAGKSTPTLWRCMTVP